MGGVTGSAHACPSVSNGCALSRRAGPGPFAPPAEDEDWYCQRDEVSGAIIRGTVEVNHATGTMHFVAGGSKGGSLNNSF